MCAGTCVLAHEDASPSLGPTQCAEDLHEAAHCQHLPPTCCWQPVQPTCASAPNAYTAQAGLTHSSALPALQVSVAGVDTYPEDRSDLGTIKYMGGMLQNSTPWTVYVQNRLSRIYDVTGPQTSLGIGDDATFTWDSDGYGEFFCYVDSKRPAQGGVGLLASVSSDCAGCR
jgi:hypothetical protein